MPPHSPLALLLEALGPRSPHTSLHCSRPPHPFRLNEEPTLYKSPLCLPCPFLCLGSPATLSPTAHGLPGPTMYPGLSPFPPQHDSSSQAGHAGSRAPVLPTQPLTGRPAPQRAFGKVWGKTACALAIPAPTPLAEGKTSVPDQFCFLGDHKDREAGNWGACSVAGAKKPRQQGQLCHSLTVTLGWLLPLWASTSTRT